MRARRLTALIISTAFLTIGGVCSFAADQQPPTKTLPDQKIGTKEELSMFFEEKDLVTANKRATPEREAPAIATVVTAEEIRNMGARNLLDVLNMVPGMGISFTEDGVNMIEVRGIRTALSEKILIMIDGHSLNRNGFGSSVWALAERMPVENVKQVEVVRGPGSALYGANAFVATVNIITRDADEINGFEMKAAGGLNDTYKGNITTGKVLNDKLNVTGSVDYFNTKGPKLRVESDTLLLTPFSKAPGYADMRFRQTDTFLKINYGDLSFRGGYRNSYKGEYIGLGYALTGGAHQDVDVGWAELAYAYRFNNALSANIKVFGDYFEQDPLVKVLPSGFPGFSDGMLGKPLMKDGTVGTELQFDWDLFKNNHLILGAAYSMMMQYDTKQFANFNPITFAPIGPVQQVANWNKNVTRHVGAAYMQDEWKLFERVSLTAGVRYDHYSDFGDTVNPRGGVVWQFLERGTLKFLYGQAFRAPSFQELYNINNPIVVGNPDLKPEKIRTYEVAVSYRFARWLGVDINYFYSEITDLINWDTSASPARFANIGKARVQGVETGIRGSYFNGLSWKLSYAFQNPRDGMTNQLLPYVPQHRAKGSINYSLNRYVNLHTDLLWTGQRPRAQGDTRTEMPSYFTADLAVTFKNFIKNLELQAAVHNLFDKKFYDPDTSGIAKSVQYDFPREGISGLLTISYKF
jgi:iron complex outermembrane receptor protein